MNKKINTISFTDNPDIYEIEDRNAIHTSATLYAKANSSGDVKLSFMTIDTVPERPKPKPIEYSETSVLELNQPISTLYIRPSFGGTVGNKTLRDIIWGYIIPTASIANKNNAEIFTNPDQFTSLDAISFYGESPLIVKSNDSKIHITYQYFESNIQDSTKRTVINADPTSIFQFTYDTTVLTIPEGYSLVFKESEFEVIKSLDMISTKPFPGQFEKRGN